MEDLIKKWKTIIKNDKTKEQELAQSTTNYSKLKMSEKLSDVGNTKIPQTNKSESQERKNKFLKESNSDLRKKVRSSSRSNLEHSGLNPNNLNLNEFKDKLVKKLNKLIKNLKKMTDCNLFFSN